MPIPSFLIKALSGPLGLVPTFAHSKALAIALNQVMREAIAEGELDFLQGHQVGIEVEDLRVRYRLGLVNGRIEGFGDLGPADASISGNLQELLLLAARREDADTLFFQRRLRMSGSTELGLYLKNFLDAFEPPARFQPLVRALDRLAGGR